jgi:hypothetical protein
MLRRILPVVIAVGLAAGMMPAEAASKKVTKLYFANTGGQAPEGCTMSPALLTRQQDGGECSGTIGAVDGTGFISNDTYNSQRTTFKIDVNRPMTGTVYVSHFPLVFATLGPVGTPRSLPGYVVLDITYKIDSVKVGTQHIEGVVMPVEGLKSDFSFKLPKSLKNKTARKVTAAVTWTTATGLSGITYTNPYASTISVPVR